MDSAQGYWAKANWLIRCAVLTWALVLSQHSSAVRLPSWSQLLSRRGEHVTEDLLREVLSTRSVFQPVRVSHASSPSASNGTDVPARLASDPARLTTLGDLLSTRGVSLRDPAISTVFSPKAVRRLPRLAQGPSVPLAPLEPWPGQGQSAGLQPNAGPGLDNRGVSGGLPGPHPHIRAADPPPPELSVDEATMAGRLASIAYCGRSDLIAAWNCSRCGDVPGFVPHATVYDSVWDLVAYAGYYPPWNAVVLAFRGTDSSNWGQWAENMRAWRTDHMYPVPNFPHALIHSGFYSLWTGSSLQRTFTDAVAELLAARPTARLVATGHSMGGALAQLAGLEAKLAHNRTHTSVWTFGAPRVGNVAYQQLFNQFIDVSWRFTHNRDIVPSVPLQLMGFQHVAREVWEVDVEDPSAAGGQQRKLLLCDGSGEDPSCHNSACYLGLCTSIADHLVYLGLHMYQDSEEC